MRETIVPINITEEEKEILAVFSKRQFMLIFPPGVLALIHLIWGNIPFIKGFGDIFLRGIVALFVIGISICLAYIKLDKYEMYLSQYIMAKLKFRRSQKTYY